jgi:hypothetical protein
LDSIGSRGVGKRRKVEKTVLDFDLTTLLFEERVDDVGFLPIDSSQLLLWGWPVVFLFERKKKKKKREKKKLSKSCIQTAGKRFPLVGKCLEGHN